MAFKYTGILAKPRPYSGIPGPLADEKTKQAWFERESEERMLRWRALFEVHGVEYGDCPALLLRLAETHVPGLARARPPGPRQMWDVLTTAELRIAVDDYIAEQANKGKHVSIRQACGHLRKKEPWRSKLRDGKNPLEALRGHYNNAEPLVVRALRAGRSLDLSTASRVIGVVTHVDA